MESWPTSTRGSRRMLAQAGDRTLVAFGQLDLEANQVLVAYHGDHLPLAVGRPDQAPRRHIALLLHYNFKMNGIEHRKSIVQYSM